MLLLVAAGPPVPAAAAALAVPAAVLQLHLLLLLLVVVMLVLASADAAAAAAPAVPWTNLQGKKPTARHLFRNPLETAKHHLISCQKWREIIRNNKLPRRPERPFWNPTRLLLLLVVMLVLVLASADATAAAAAPAAGAAKLACLCFTSPAAAAAAPAAVVVRNKSQKYYSLARSPLRLPGSADMSNSTSSWDASLGKNADGSLKDLPTLECFSRWANSSNSQHLSRYDHTSILWCLYGDGSKPIITYYYHICGNQHPLASYFRYRLGPRVLTHSHIPTWLGQERWWLCHKGGTWGQGSAANHRILYDILQWPSGNPLKKMFIKTSHGTPRCKQRISQVLPCVWLPFWYILGKTMPQTIPQSSPFSYIGGINYKPFPNGWFMALFYPHYVILWC